MAIYILLHSECQNLNTHVIELCPFASIGNHFGRWAPSIKCNCDAIIVISGKCKKMKHITVPADPLQNVTSFILLPHSLESDSLIH